MKEEKVGIASMDNLEEFYYKEKKNGVIAKKGWVWGQGRVFCFFLLACLLACLQMGYVLTCMVIP